MELEQALRASLIELPEILKKHLAFDVEEKRRDYLFKKDNLQKYIFDACESVEACGVAYLKYSEELGKVTDEKLQDGITAVVGRNYEIEARLFLRRLMELFIELKNFKAVPIEDLESRIKQYFLIRTLQAYEQKRFFSEVYAELISQYFTKRVDEISEEIGDFKPSFYLNVDSSNPKKQKIKDLIRSYRQILDKSFGLMSPMEKMIIGESYQQYAETSNVIHGWSGLAKFDLKNYHQEMMGIYSRTHIFAISILKDLVDIGKVIPFPVDLTEAIMSLKNDLPDNFQFSVGDIVLVKKQVKARISEIKQSSYGINRYTVEYIDKVGDFTRRFEETEFLVSDLSKNPNE